jgi:hypothetical protein
MRVVDGEVKLKQQHPGESLLSTGRIPVGRPGSAAKMSLPHQDEEQRQEDEKHPPSLPHPHAAEPLRLQDAAVGDIEDDRGENQHHEALGEVRNGPYQRGVWSMPSSRTRTPSAHPQATYPGGLRFS